MPGQAQSITLVPPEARLKSEMNRRMPAIVREEKIGGIGMTVIRNGRVVWSGYYGNQSPGVPVTGETAFNTASIAKTITTETLLALAAADSPSVIRIRIEGLRGESLADLLQMVLARCAEELASGAAVVVQAERIRLRHLPLSPS